MRFVRRVSCTAGDSVRVVEAHIEKEGEQGKKTTGGRHAPSCKKISGGDESSIFIGPECGRNKYKNAWGIG